MTDPTQAMPTPEPGGPGGTGGPGGGGHGSGTVLAGRYRLESIAGRGGMAEVWRAHDTVLQRTVAVKWFTPGAGDVAAPARQQAEMKLLAGFNHPGLVTVYDAGVQPTPMGDRAFVVMEFVDGPTLAARLARAPMPPTAVGAIGSTVADALAYVHARGVVHRDIKPGNILLEGGDDAGPTTVKLADFGIARLVDDARMTKTGMTVGTASYLSPEQVRGEEITPKSDVYSLALVLLEAFTGAVEFPGTPVEAAVARLSRDPVIPGRLGPVWGPLLAEMTARDPRLRPTAREVADRLSGAPGASTSATTSYIPPAAAVGATAYIPPTGGVPRPLVVGAAAGAMPPVRPVADEDPLAAERPPRPLWPWILGVLLLLVIGAGVAFAINLGGDGASTDTTTTPPATTSAATTPTTTAPSTPTTEATTEAPTTPETTATVTESVTPTSSPPTTPPSSTPPTTTPPTTDTPTDATSPAGNGNGNGNGNGGGGNGGGGNGAKSTTTPTG